MDGPGHGAWTLAPAAIRPQRVQSDQEGTVGNADCGGPAGGGESGGGQVVEETQSRKYREGMGEL